jgi:pantothenate kinase
VQAEDVEFDELLRRARDMAGEGSRRVLGIVGAPGSGKSTLAAAIVAELGPHLAALVPMDGFHLANSVLVAQGKRARKGAIDTFDAMGCALLLERIRDQASGDPVIYAPVFRRDIEEPIACANPIAWTTPLVVVEGNYFLHDDAVWRRAAACLDAAWYLEPDTGLRHERLIRRHEEFGKDSGEARDWALGPDEANARLIARTAPRADRVLRLLTDLGPHTGS